MLLLQLLLIAQVFHPCPGETGQIEKHPEKKVIFPKVLRKVEPEFTPEAQRAKIAPSLLLLAVTVPTAGPVCNIRVVSPIGFGLDEAAVAAVRQWDMKPATVDGKRVAIEATIEVKFSYQGEVPDRDEKRRAAFNRALDLIQEGDAAKVQKGIQMMQALSEKKYPTANAFMALAYFEGTLVRGDLVTAFELAKRADERNEPLGMYVLALIYLDGRIVTKDEVKGQKLMKEAAIAGRAEARLWLGDRLREEGKLEEARREYRQCAGTFKLCATRLAQSTSEKKP
ncbi:MAG: TonB family protein [Acidobacteria bacterium]|nr:TonB family protein [Acidobacteriota bacterium]